MKTPKKHRTFIIYAKETCKLQLTHDEHKELSALAKAQGTTVSDLLLNVIKDEIEK
jgi:NRPS condensation-like uncharacterized protein